LHKFFNQIRGFFLFSCLMLFGISNTLAEKIPEVPGVKLSPEKLDLARQIRALFPDAPIMVRVAMCESELIHKKDGELLRNSHGSSARGAFQVLMRYHGPQMKKLGLDPYRTDEYLAYVRVLYDQQKLAPWAESRYCWNKYQNPPRG
jgi:hypothetical protein